MRSRSSRLLSAGLAVLFLPFVFGLVRTANRIIVPADDTIAEDMYAFGGNVTIDGVVDGDLFVLTGDLRITGTVTGDVLGFAGTRVTVEGVVGGSLRVVSPTITVTGTVGDDVAVLAAGLTVDAVVGRDILAVSGDADIRGTAGRDLRVQAWSLDVGGEVGGDVRAKADSVALNPAARVAGDVVYRASSEVSVAAEASVGGRVIRSRVFSPVWARALERAIAFLGFLGFVLAGLVLGWVFRGTSRRAIEAVGTRPWRTLGIGAALLVLPPVLVIPLSLTLVGLPLALLLLVAWVVFVFLGALPAVTRVGKWVLRGRGGAAAALSVGAVLWWAAMWLLPLAAVMVFLTGTVVGLGALARAAWAGRTASAAS